MRCMHFVAHFIEHFVRSLCRSLSKSPDKVLDKVCDKDGFGRLHILLLIMVFLPLTALAQAQPTSEDAAFAAAARSLTQLGAYKQARKEFREFREKYPQSVKIPEAVLFEAMAAVKLNDHEQAASLLASNLAKAGVYTEEYHYWLGEANLQGRNYLAAAESFARLTKNFPESQRLLDASYGEALARFRLKEWPRVTDLLQAPAGTFQKIAAARPNDELVIRGQLLLADALLEQKQPAAAESVLNNLNIGAAPAEVKWQWQNLLCRIQLAENKPQSALAGSSNLVTLADAAAAPNLRAESVALQAGMLQQLNRLADAAAAYEQNLRKEIPAERRREALLKIIDLTLAQDAHDAAAAKLERLLADHASDAG